MSSTRAVCSAAVPARICEERTGLLSPSPLTEPARNRLGGADVLHLEHWQGCGLLRGSGAGRLSVAAQLPTPMADLAANDGQVHFPNGQVSGSLCVILVVSACRGKSRRKPPLQWRGAARYLLVILNIEKRWIKPPVHSQPASPESSSLSSKAPPFFPNAPPSCNFGLL